MRFEPRIQPLSGFVKNTNTSAISSGLPALPVSAAPLVARLSNADMKSGSNLVLTAAELTVLARN